MTRIFLTACVATLLGSGAMAQHLPQGIYEQGTCSENPYSDTRIEISGNELLFYESACTLSNPEPVRGMAGAYLYDGACSGEGMEWSGRYLLMPGWGDQLVLVYEGYAAMYALCEAGQTGGAGGGTK